MNGCERSVVPVSRGERWRIGGPERFDQRRFQALPLLTLLPAEPALPFFELLTVSCVRAPGIRTWTLTQPARRGYSGADEDMPARLHGNKGSFV